ncbi:MAG: ABC transporter substrate-binding protein [Planctomycetaceae bacterium]
MLCAAVVATACQPRGAAEGAPGRIVVFQDGSLADARTVVSPGVLGLQTGLAGSYALEILETGGSASTATAQAASAAADPSVAAAVIAPFTALPDGAVSVLRDAGVPVLSLSSSTATPRGPGAPFRSFVATIPEDAAAIARLAEAGAPGTVLCVAGGRDGGWSASLSAALLRRASRSGGARRTAALRGTPSEVAAAAGRRGCGVLAWTGTAAGAAVLWRGLPSTPRRPALLVADRARTAGLLETVGPLLAEADLDGVCACADLTASGDPAAQRFLHDFQAATGLDPGPFAAEGWDVGRALATIEQGARSRAEVAAVLEARPTIGGVGGPYAWKGSGLLAVPGVRAYRAVGWRWLSPIVAPGMSGERARPSGAGRA